MHIIFYNIFLFLYRVGVRIVALWNQKAKKWLEGREQVFSNLEVAFNDKTRPTIWMHCSSLGEFEQGRPVLEQLRVKYPHHRFLLTFFSPSGYEVRKDYKGVDYIFYLPLDSKQNAKRFVEIVNPSLVLWIKYDYWYYYLNVLKQRKIPLLLVSGVFLPFQTFFKWYGRLHRYMLDCFTHLFIQTQESADLLKPLSFLKNITVAGDTRFDRVVEIASRFEPIEKIEQFCGQSVTLVAGSTWVEDDEELDHYANAHPEIKFVIAPHEIDEDRLKEMEELYKKSVRYSRYSPEDPASTKANVLLIDNIGMLSRIYHYATITYIGGAFSEGGVHNVLEAAVYGKSVIFGPAYDWYLEAVDLVELEAAFTVENALDLETLLNDLLADKEWLDQTGKKAKEYVYNKTGATQKLLSYIQENRLLTS